MYSINLLDQDKKLHDFPNVFLYYMLLLEKSIRYFVIWYFLSVKWTSNYFSSNFRGKKAIQSIIIEIFPNQWHLFHKIIQQTVNTKCKVNHVIPSRTFHLVNNLPAKPQTNKKIHSFPREATAPNLWMNLIPKAKMLSLSIKLYIYQIHSQKKKKVHKSRTYFYTYINIYFSIHIQYSICKEIWRFVVNYRDTTSIPTLSTCCCDR